MHHLDTPCNAYVELCVTDNGCGIETENLKKIMEPFFTTKSEGKGTGLGLAMVYGILESHHGYIDISSELNVGTSIHLFLPLTEQSNCCLPPTETFFRGNGETILLVDDQQEVRETCREVLETLGYTVLEAVDGVEALDAYASHATCISAVLSDVVMPHMQGIELACRIKQHNPVMPVILISGYDKDDVLDQHTLLLVDKVLAKPFSIASISKVLHQLLLASHVPEQMARKQLKLNWHPSPD